MERNYNEAELIDVCADICVINNAMTIKSFSPELEITINESDDGRNPSKPSNSY